jgi:AcrR family transcriptional regulator
VRADAVRTRKQLLDAAAEMFAERGAEASVAEIAERAGIGKGTVFRHFATKEDLIAAIVGDLLDDLVRAARQQQAADPTEALREFMTYGVGRLADNRALCDVASGSVRHPDVQAGVEKLMEAAQELVDRASVREDVTGQDVVLLMTGVHQAAAPLRDGQPELWRRYLGFLLDGLLDTTSSGTHSRT